MTGRIENGQLIVTAKGIVKPVIETAEPNNGFYHTSYWQENETEIVKVWVNTPNKKEPPEDDEEATIEDYEAVLSEVGI